MTKTRKTRKTAPKATKDPLNKVLTALRRANTVLSARLDASATELARAKRERDTWAKAADAVEAQCAAQRAAEAFRAEKVDSEAKLHAAMVELSKVPRPAPLRAKAYLMAHLDLYTMKVDDARIFSEPSPTTDYAKERWLLIREYEGASFGDAYERTVRTIEPYIPDGWFRDWILKHDEEEKRAIGSICTARIVAKGNKATVAVTQQGVEVDFPALSIQAPGGPAELPVSGASVLPPLPPESAPQEQIDAAVEANRRPGESFDDALDRLVKEKKGTP